MTEHTDTVIQKLKQDFPDTPLVAILNMDNTMKMFGSFRNGAEAGEWYKTVPHGVRIVWQPLRNPYLKREYEDFYLPERLENLEKEYDHTLKDVPMTTALLVKADGEVRHINLPITDAHIMIHHMVGGHFDVVRHKTRGELHAFVHDEGLLLKLEPNVAMSYLFGQLLVGDIVLSRSAPDGSEADFAVDEQTMEIYKKCNTNQEMKKLFQQRSDDPDFTWEVEFSEE